MIHRSQRLSHECISDTTTCCDQDSTDVQASMRESNKFDGKTKKYSFCPFAITLTGVYYLRIQENVW